MILSDRKFVFISFASPQESIATRLYKALRDANVSCFCTNSDLKIGDISYIEISKNIERDGCVLLPVYSDEYFSPDRVSLLEFTAFVNKHRANLRNRIFPIKMDDFEVPDFYKMILYYPLRTDEVDVKLGEIVQRLKAMVSTPLDSHPLPKDALAEDGMAGIAREEWDKVSQRLTDVGTKPLTMTHIYLYGWLSCSGFGELIPKWWIAAYQIGANINELSRTIGDDNRPSFIAKLCTIRYLSSCVIAASGEHDYPDYILRALLEGMNNKDQNIISNIRLCKNYAERLTKSQAVAERKRNLEDIMKCLGTIASIIGITQREILTEELSSKRRGSRVPRMAKIAYDNTITHQIIMHMEDRKGIYIEIMDVIKEEVQFNIIKSVSETLVPDKLAMVTLSICCHLTDKNLEAKLIETIRANESLGNRVLDISVIDVGLPGRSAQ